MYYSKSGLKVLINIVAIFILFICASSSIAASTSNWIPVKYTGTDETTSSDIAAPSWGASYLTVELKASRVYQNSNWWTSLIERNRKAILDVTVSGKVNNSMIEDVRTSGPQDIKRANSQIDFGWANIVIDKLPTTYNNLEIKVRISKSSEDGLDALLNTIADISSKTPSLSVSQTTVGMVSASKVIADYLFNKKLLEPKLSSTLQFPSAGKSLTSGYYIAFAGDTPSEYNSFLKKPSGSETGLEWDGSQLAWNGNSISTVSYFVVKVSYLSHLLDDPLHSLSFNVQKSWASLYSIARRKPDNLKTIDEKETKKIVEEIQSYLDTAHTLLDSDPDFIQTERDSIHTAIHDDIEKKLNNRIVKLSPTKPTGGLSLRNAVLQKQD